MVTEQIANLSTGNCRQGSSPCLSAFFSGCSVARLSRLLWEQEAAGSNPATPTKKIQTLSLDFFLVSELTYFKVFFIITVFSVNFLSSILASP